MLPSKELSLGRRPANVSLSWEVAFLRSNLGISPEKKTFSSSTCWKNVSWEQISIQTLSAAGFLHEVEVVSSEVSELMPIHPIRLRHARLLMSPKKCNFFCREVQYLGHVVSEQGIKTDPSKISAVRDWPIPKEKSQVRSFIGLCTNYRKFVKSFSSIAKPLHRLTEDKASFLWTEECQQAFEQLKKCLAELPVLAYPLTNSEFILDTEASNFAMGAVLYRKELLAIVKSIEHFHHYLYGRSFTVRTDHAALRWLLSFKKLEGQIARWIERLQGYDFKIEHRPGRIHSNANALSRRPCEESQCKSCSRLEEKEKEEEKHHILRTVCHTLEAESWRKTQEKDDEIGFILKRKILASKPTWQEISAQSSTTKYLWKIWDSLEIKHELLFRRWESADGKEVSLLLVVPKAKVEEILKEFPPIKGILHLQRVNEDFGDKEN
ncbi:hypothetical protein KPH14_000923 [Odynerus spinipes]|uniref:RNA-directed DNA polymerase n=1 Tax=Odynerus spinipes TaxID=1348599 RepID=A0AAD9RF82_9HYME|nr:hypothetical protein KPH14_000923 [Odynerus spinipes]